MSKARGPGGLLLNDSSSHTQCVDADAPGGEIGRSGTIPRQINKAHGPVRGGNLVTQSLAGPWHSPLMPDGTLGLVPFQKLGIDTRQCGS